MKLNEKPPRSEPLFNTIFAGEPEKNRAAQIFERFKEFHNQNPRVWNLFQRFAFEVIKAGYAHYSADAIFHRIRWHVHIETVGDTVKLNDHYTSYYARLFAVAYPAHAELFQHRKRTSEERPAQGIDLTVFNTGTPSAAQENKLAHQLEDMLRGL